MADQRKSFRPRRLAFGGRLVPHALVLAAGFAFCVALMPAVGQEAGLKNGAASLAAGKYDAAVMGIPFDSGTTYRPGTRFGPQGIRRISALYTPYNYELGVDLREQMTLCDAGDVFTIPANLEKSFDQITKGVSHVASSGALPIMLGGDHSIGFPCVRGTSLA